MSRNMDPKADFGKLNEGLMDDFTRKIRADEQGGRMTFTLITPSGEEKTLTKQETLQLLIESYHNARLAWTILQNQGRIETQYGWIVR